MPGAGSALDRNDHRLIERLVRQLDRLNENLEEYNEANTQTEESQ
jgi:hypothetical protein